MKLKKNKKNNNEKILKMIETIRNNSDLPILYMSKYLNESTDILSQKYEKISNYMSFDFSDKDILFRYYGYPTDESESYLGSVMLSTNKYNILGISVGDNVVDAIKKLESFGFELNQEKKEDFMTGSIIISLSYNTFDIAIWTDKDEIKINKLELEAVSKYLGNRIY